MLILRSRLLEAFDHGFTTRDGGSSPAPWASLNLGGAAGDEPARVSENWRRLGEATGLAFARVRQVHGAGVVEAEEACEPRVEADAVISAAPGVAATVAVADCVPILLADPDSGRVAAVHAGWRGTIARIAAAAVARLAAAGAAPDRLLAAIGPSIGPCCYEVAPDLAARFAAEVGEEAVRPGRTPRLDLRAANAAILRAAGVRADRVETLGHCTACEPERFYSHRRDAGRTGRHAAFIAPRPRSSDIVR
ncbi:MAG TPA: peptidoglycan editing factor PgeF [Anaeromyxobacteraceae bacterium]|nr:peptidoglycan editing factor PgeF [Anaeromyxobacteraceae bacterium]